MDHFEKFDNQLLISYESTLAEEGKEICKEVNSILGDNDELLVEKTKAYSYFCCTNTKRVDIDTKLIERCKKYLNNMSNYNQIKNTLEYISRTRKTV